MAQSKKKILAICGSTRSESANLRLVLRALVNNTVYPLAVDTGADSVVVLSQSCKNCQCGSWHGQCLPIFPPPGAPGFTDNFTEADLHGGIMNLSIGADGFELRDAPVHTW